MTKGSADAMTDENLNWMSAGQSLTCDNGHIIATAKERVRIGRPPWVDKLDWKIAVPEEGKRPECAICGALWIIHHDREGVFFVVRTTWVCVDGEWHPPLTADARKYLDAMRGFGVDEPGT